MGSIIILFAVIAAVLPPATVPSIPEQIGRNAFYYQQFDGSAPPMTFIFGPWESLPDAFMGIKQRPAKARIAIVCPGRSTQCAPIEAYFEMKVYTYGPEYQHHPQELTVAGVDRKLLSYSGNHTAAVLEGRTKDLPKTWIPGSTDSPQLSVVSYVTGGEFVLPELENALGDNRTVLLLGDWTTMSRTSLDTDLRQLIHDAAQPARPTKSIRRK